MKKVWMAVAASVTVAIMLLSFFLLGGLAQDPQGFSESELSAPTVTSIVREEELPGILSGMDFPAHVISGFSYTPVYETYGGIVELFVVNNGPNLVYVRSYGLWWDGDDRMFSINCSRTVEVNEKAMLGALHFDGPGENGTAEFHVSMNMWASSSNGELWSDKGEWEVNSVEVEVLPEDPFQEKEVQENPVRYYNQVNELVDLEVVQDLKEQVLGAVPGEFSVHQVIETFELVRNTFAYADDEDNHWQSAAETIELGAGDCEDHAILMASLLTALGGDCRVNLIPGHAFPTVYVGNSTSEMMEVQENIMAFYGNQVPVYWTYDHLGYWLVVDTVGMPYAGGFPAASIPVGSFGGTSWNFEDGDLIRTIDVTGETVPGLVL